MVSTKDHRFLTSSTASPLDFIYSSEKESADFRQIVVSDGGSQTCCAKETIQGVPNYGITDSAAEITIMGGALFKHVASAAHLKKRDFHKTDKTPPRTYVNDTFTLDGMMKLDIAFDRNMMRTPVYRMHKNSCCCQKGTVNKSTPSSIMRRWKSSMDGRGKPRS